MTEPDFTSQPSDEPAAAFERRLVLDVHALRAIEFELMALDATLEGVPWDAAQRTAIESRITAIHWVTALGEEEP